MPSPPTEAQVPSLGVIEAALEREDGYCRERANGMDGKAQQSSAPPAWSSP